MDPIVFFSNKIHESNKICFYNNETKIATGRNNYKILKSQTV